jgi:hypothetical protein
MDWDRAIERNSEALKAIVATLFAMLGDAAAARLPRELHRAALRVLRPAESALRRLIVIAARDLKAEPAPARPKPQGLIIRGGGNRLAFSSSTGASASRPVARQAARLPFRASTFSATIPGLCPCDQRRCLRPLRRPMMAASTAAAFL